jgi:HAD superfamily hydrolase (TIGR01509 family)
MADITDILFDLGGVLLVHPRHLTQRNISEATGITPEQAHDRFRRHERELRTGGMTMGTFLAELKREFGLADSPETLLDRYAETYGKYAPIDGAMAGIIASLRPRYRISAWTNTVDAHYAYNENRGLFSGFDLVFASCRIGQVKPEAAAADYVLAQLGTVPESCLFVDDRQENVAMAIHAGMRGYVYTDPDAFRTFLGKEVL